MRAQRCLRRGAGAAGGAAAGGAGTADGAGTGRPGTTAIGGAGPGRPGTTTPPGAKGPSPAQRVTKNIASTWRRRRSARGARRGTGTANLLAIDGAPHGKSPSG